MCVCASVPLSCAVRTDVLYRGRCDLRIVLRRVARCWSERLRVRWLRLRRQPVCTITANTWNSATLDGARSTRSCRGIIIVSLSTSSVLRRQFPAAVRHLPPAETAPARPAQPRPNIGCPRCSVASFRLICIRRFLVGISGGRWRAGAAPAGRRSRPSAAVPPITKCGLCQK